MPFFPLKNVNPTNMWHELLVFKIRTRQVLKININEREVGINQFSKEMEIVNKFFSVLVCTIYWHTATSLPNSLMLCWGLAWFAILFSLYLIGWCESLLGCFYSCIIRLLNESISSVIFIINNINVFSLQQKYFWILDHRKYFKLITILFDG